MDKKWVLTKVEAISGIGSQEMSNRIEKWQNINIFVQQNKNNQVNNSNHVAKFRNEVKYLFQKKIKDVDGNIYHTVKIGTQVWMVENLKTTKYNNGTAIPLVPDDSAWGALSTPGYCWYNNDEVKNKATYGAIYNWYTVNMSKLCPTGWHVPTDAEWTTLTTYLGGESIAGGKLKESGTTHWQSPNTEATNESGFTALPEGGRSIGGNFDNVGLLGALWSSTESNAVDAWFSFVYYEYSYLRRIYNGKLNGLSVRCLRDN